MNQSKDVMVCLSLWILILMVQTYMIHMMNHRLDKMQPHVEGISYVVCHGEEGCAAIEERLNNK